MGKFGLVAQFAQFVKENIICPGAEHLKVMTARFLSMFRGSISFEVKEGKHRDQGTVSCVGDIFYRPWVNV